MDDSRAPDADALKVDPFAGDGLLADFLAGGETGRAKCTELGGEGEKYSRTAGIPARADAPHMAGIKKVRYTHDAMIDLIIADPWIKQNEMATHFGYTVPWVSLVMSSDAFQARLAERKDAVVDPAIRASIEEHFKGILLQSVEKVKAKLEAGCSDEFLLRIYEGTGKMLGHGANKNIGVVQNNYVVHAPAKAGSSEQWARDVGGTVEDCDAIPHLAIEPPNHD